MSILQEVKLAQINAAERAVVKNLHDHGLCDPGSCEFCREAFSKAIEVPPMSATLEDKLAVMVWYLEEVRQRRRSSDPRAFESYLDDSEITAWLEQMNRAGRIRNTRFTSTRQS
jgi:hypothetical protein